MLQRRIWLATGRTLNLPKTLQGSGMGPGWGLDLGALQLHSKEAKSKATDVVVHAPFGSAQPSGITKNPHWTTLHTWEVYPADLIPGRHSNTNRAVLIHPASVVGRSLGKLGGGEGEHALEMVLFLRTLISNISANNHMFWESEIRDRLLWWPFNLN